MAYETLPTDSLFSDRRRARQSFTVVMARNDQQLTVCRLFGITIGLPPVSRFCRHKNGHKESAPFVPLFRPESNERRWRDPKENSQPFRLLFADRPFAREYLGYLGTRSEYDGKIGGFQIAALHQHLQSADGISLR